jgi:hypothetical protein
MGDIYPWRRWRDVRHGFTTAIDTTLHPVLRPVRDIAGIAWSFGDHAGDYVPFRWQAIPPRG